MPVKCKLCGSVGVNYLTCPLNPWSGNKEYVKHNNVMLNIYDEPLQKCREQGMTNGSWNHDGKCSELVGGVHQICVDHIAHSTPNFSKSTGQSEWSDERGRDNHCVCLGAWSLYSKKNLPKKKVLKCNAIPKIALDKSYKQDWNTWREENNLIVDGVESLVDNCLIDASPRQQASLRNNYCDFAKDVDLLNSSEYYKDQCE